MDLLLIEDDELIGSGVVPALEREGYAVTWCRDGAQARALVRERAYAVIVLDLGLPFVDGMDLLVQWRHRGVITPVLVLTARDTPDDKIDGLDGGADDFLTKPFDLGELLARLRALLRRHSEGPIIEYEGLRLDCEQRTATLDGAPLELSRREFLLLRTLLSKPGRVYSRAQLEEALYDDEREIASNAIEVHVHNLRRKTRPGLIGTVRGLGYRAGGSR